MSKSRQTSLQFTIGKPMRLTIKPLLSNRKTNSGRILFIKWLWFVVRWTNIDFEDEVDAALKSMKYHEVDL